MAVNQLNWPAPAAVKAVFSDRLGGVSAAPYSGFNLGLHVNDKPEHVIENRRQFALTMPSEPLWLKQIHSTHIIQADDYQAIPSADACMSVNAKQVCVVMTADCLPILLCDKQAQVVAAVHAGWRGLVDGILENSVSAMRRPTENLMAWIGPAIGPQHFEVGAEVKAAFIHKSKEAELAFTPSSEGKFLADLSLLATQRLQALGVQAIYYQAECTASLRERYFSYRRDGQTGRMAAAIWLQD